MISVAYAADAHHHAGPFYAEPAFWVGVAFILVVALAFRPVLNAIGKGLDARAAGIKSRLDDAAKLREDAQEMLATYQRKQRDAMKEAEEIIAHAKAEAERLSKQAAKDLAEQMARRESQAMDRIAQAEAAALREVQNLAVDIAVNAAQAILAQNAGSPQVAALLDKAIADLPGKLH